MSSAPPPLSPEGAPPAEAELHPLVRRLNSTLEDYPMPSFLGFLGLSYGVFGASFLALNAAGFDMPALAVAGAVSRLTRYLKKPLDLVLCVALARGFPAATAIRLGPLIIPPMPKREGPQPEGGSDTGGLLARWADFATRWLEGPVNTYGAPFMLARWITGLSFVSLTTAGVQHGVDVTALLGLVFSDPGSVMVVSAKASALAGAMVLNTAALPLRVLAIAHLGRPLFVALELQPVARGVEGGAAARPAAAEPHEKP